MIIKCLIYYQKIIDPKFKLFSNTYHRPTYATNQAFKT